MVKKRLKLVVKDEDLLYWILNQCSLRDCIRMGAVCKSWLSVSRWNTRKRPPQLPWLMMMLSNPDVEAVEEARCFFSLSDHTIYDAIKFPEIEGKRCCGSFNNADARGWLMIMDDNNNEWGLFHPWCRIQLQLPTLPRHQQYDITRVRAAAMSDDAQVVAVVYNSSFLAFCRIGDNVWTVVPQSSALPPSKWHIDDVIYHKGQFYVLTMGGSVGIIRVNAANPYIEILTEVVREEEDEDEDPTTYPRAYLVADSDSAGERLLIFVRISPPLSRPGEPQTRDAYETRRTTGFNVYEIGLEESGEWKKNPVEVKSLGDRLIFLGQNSSMLVMASQFPGFRGNHIYFTDDFLECCLGTSEIGYTDLGIFNIEDTTIKPLFIDRFHPIFSPPIWIAPPL